MLKIYMSHPIRSPYGDEATPEQMKTNCLMAVTIGDKIRQYMAFNHRDVPGKLYVPAEHEELVNRAWHSGMLTVEQILELDCRIIAEEYNDLLIVFAPYGPPIQGCHIEMQHAVLHHIPVLVFKDMSEFKEKIEVYLEENDYE